MTAHLSRGGSLESAQNIFGGARDVLHERYTQAKEKMTASVALPADCIKLHMIRMVFLLYLLDRKTRHALLQTLCALELNTRAFKLATF